MLSSKIKNKKTPNSSIQISKTSIVKNIEIDFTYFCFKSVNLKFFTNFLKDEKEYFKVLNNFYKQTIPHLISKKFEELEQVKNSHCHYINEEKKVNKILTILENYRAIGFELPNFEDESTDFYQLAGPMGIRMIGYKIGNIFYLLFLDVHHLIYPSLKHNNYDYNNYSYSDGDNWIGDSEVINYEDFFIENCTECVKFDVLTSPINKEK